MGRTQDFGVGSAPVEVAKAGADAYMARNGLHRPDQGRDYSSALVVPQVVRSVASAYNRLPEFAEGAVPAFRQMAEETKRQFDHLTNPVHRGGMGFDVGVSSQDPYGDAASGGTKDFFNDIAQRRIKVMSTATTGGHAIFSNDENDMFRAVHDVFGHGGTGRGVDRHGEEAAFRKHARMFSPVARQALATETRGQNHAMIAAGGEFQPQKVALLPEPMTQIGYTNRGSVGARARALLQAREFHARQGL